MPDRVLLAAGIAMPALYFATLILAGVANPGVSEGLPPSMLGTAGAPHPWVFNAGAIASGVAGVLGAIGLARALPRLGAGRVVAWLSAATVLLPCVALVMAGLFPLPNPLHYGFSLTLAGLFAPLLGAVALRRARDDAPAVMLMVAAFVLVLVLFAALSGVGRFVNDDNAGYWIRAVAVPLFGSVGFLAWRVRRALANGVATPAR
ncbi:MAG TPA: DUF998 domain-containing protein [Candidatus Elarobacter sp.]|jgi:hypothetical membrane protein|nr:DUF998 domain-containing protein [Candidatus Elarobacter sp.]